jgi:hypothetical protein
MIRPEGMSRPVGTAMQAKPGTSMIGGMIRFEGMSRPVVTAIQANPGTDMAFGMIHPEGSSRPVGTIMRNDQAWHGYEPPRRHEPPCGHGQAPPQNDRAGTAMSRLGGSTAPLRAEYAFVSRGLVAPAHQRMPEFSLHAPIPSFVDKPEMGQLANKINSQSAVLTP